MGLGLTDSPAVVGPGLPGPHATSGRRGDRGGGGHPGPGDGHGLYSPDWTDGSYSLDGWVGSHERPCQACTGSAVHVKAVQRISVQYSAGTSIQCSVAQSAVQCIALGRVMRLDVGLALLKG